MLTKLEKQTLALYLQGLSYQQIAQIIDCKPKSVDNAIQRVKKKLDERMKKQEEAAWNSGRSV